MKTILMVILAMILCVPAFADEIILNSDHTISLPAAKRISGWEIIKINAAEKLMIVQYQWKNASGAIIDPGGGRQRYWVCQDSCFAEIFLYEITGADVGKKIGRSLRTLVWNKMKTDILAGGNDGVFK